MKNRWFIVLIGAFFAVSGAAHAAPGSKPATAPIHAVIGEMVQTVQGTVIADVSFVEPDGTVLIVLDHKVVSIPVSALSLNKGQLTTSLTDKQIRARE